MSDNTYRDATTEGEIRHRIKQELEIMSVIDNYNTDFRFVGKIIGRTRQVQADHEVGSVPQLVPHNTMKPCFVRVDTFGLGQLYSMYIKNRTGSILDKLTSLEDVLSKKALDLRKGGK